jgi:hypothetical protein
MISYCYLRHLTPSHTGGYIAIGRHVSPNYAFRYSSQYTECRTFAEHELLEPFVRVSVVSSLPWGLNSGTDRHTLSAERIIELRNMARRAREFAFALTDKQVVANLNSYATELEAEVSKLEAPTLPPAA